jgi:hypothetical protein
MNRTVVITNPFFPNPPPNPHPNLNMVATIPVPVVQNQNNQNGVMRLCPSRESLDWVSQVAINTGKTVVGAGKAVIADPNISMAIAGVFIGAAMVVGSSVLFTIGFTAFTIRLCDASSNRPANQALLLAGV